MPSVFVNLDHAPVTLNIEEPRTGDAIKLAADNGWGLMKRVGEIALVTGRNEVDADLWAKWKAIHADDPLLTERLITEEKAADGTPQEPDAPATPADST
jgi:hypothetical protein